MNKKRLLAALLTLTMLVGLLPTGVLAARLDDEAVPMEAPAHEPDHLATPIWEDAADEPTQADLAEVDLTSLVNIANATDVTVENSGRSANESYLDTTAEHLMDGITDRTSSEYKWVNGGVQAYIDDKGFAPWVSMDFGETRAVGGVKIFFEQADNQDVTYTYNIWTKANPQAEYVKWKDSVTATKKSSDYIQTYAFDQLTDVSAIKIEFLSAKTDNNTTDGAWIVLREIEIYGEEKPLDLTELTNIAKGMSPTLPNNNRDKDNSENPKSNLTDDDNDTEFEMYGAAVPSQAATGPDGACFMEFDFGENRSIGGFEFVVSTTLDSSYSYKYNIYGKADGASEWTEYFKDITISHTVGQNAQKHPFTSLTDLRYVRVILHSGNQWGAVSEFRIFGEAKETPPEEFDYTGLVNVTADCEVSVSGVPSENAGLLSDGDIKGLWKANPASWPSNIDFALPGDSLIKRVEIDFERVANRSMDVALGYTQNSVTDTYFPIYSGTKTAPLDKTFAYTIEDGIRTDHLRITLSNPVPSTLGPAMTEVRIYISDEKLNLAAYEDITSHASVPAGTAGDGYKEWNLQSNQQVAGFKATLNGVESIPATVTGRLKRGGTWITYLTTLQNGENPMRFLGGMSLIRVNASADDLAKLTDFQIWGSYAEPVPDTGNLAYDRPVHSGLANTTAYLATDGDKTTSWIPDSYPTYLDIDLEANYDLSEIQVFTPAQGYSEYTLYTSIDGQNFTKVGEKLNNAACADGGDKHAVSGAGATARIVRIYLEYYSASSKPVLNEIRVVGTPSADTESHLTELPRIGDFSQSSYAAAINDADVIAEVQGILRRRVGEQYVDWFTFQLAEGTAPAGSDTKYDYFTLTDEGGKIKVTGNNGVSLATGLNHYLKYYCYVNISQVGDQVTMPNAIVPIGGTVHKETKYPVRYAYNYCTHSYTMSFWNEAEWRAELDWLALNGVNVVLDITGQEMVWREFLMDMGYSHQDAKDFLAGPGYYAWAYMANLSGIGGPIHDKFLEDRAELGRKNQRIMRTLGMEPVLQAFSGMVPNDLAAHDSAAAKHILKQGVWSGCVRPDMLKTDTDTYERYAAAFYAAQKRVFGDAKYYATDPFHEGGNTGGMATNVVSRELLDSLIKNDANGDAVWVIQSWQGNPSAGLLQGLREGGPNHDQDLRSHAIVLDLYAERYPHNNEYGVNTDSNPRIEFTDTPWVWCQLNNFGGRMGLDGHLNSLHESIPATANASDHMAGIGISPEASMENPLLYDFLFETVWTADATQPLQEIDLDQWLKDYARRRYGAESRNAEQAIAILADTVYNGELRASKFTGSKSYQGAPESVINARPALSIGVASTWGNTDIFYSKAELEKAAQLLLDDYDTLSASDAYLYDLADILKQVLSNSAQNVHTQMAAAYNSKNAAAFEEKSQKFLEVIDLVNTVTGTRKEFLFGTWTGGAQQMAEGTDDFTKRIFLRNAKALVTTWFSYDQCVPGRLKDYSNRQWSGLTDTFYKARWTKWINAAKANLAAGSNGAINTGDWFQWEWEYVRSADTFSAAPNGESLKTLGENILTNYSVLDPLGENELDPAEMTVKMGSEHTSSEPDAAVNVLDRDSSTIWHTDWTDANVTGNKGRWWLGLDLGRTRIVDGLRYLPRQSTNSGRITGYEVYVTSSDAAWAALTNNSAWPATTPTDWTKVAEGTAWANDLTWKEAAFAATSARYVVLKVTASTASEYCSAAEIRITAPGKVPVESVALDQTTLTLYTNEGDGHSAALTATVTPENATNKALNWSTSNNLVASVDNGVVTAVGNGTATITVSSQDDPTVEAACTVAVKTKITGQVLIRVEPVGDPVFGSTLTASIGNITEAAKDHLSYAWYHGETATGDPISTERSYILKQADIGQKITLKVTAIDDFDGSSTATTEKAVGKAAGENMQTDPTSEPCSDANTSNGAITGLNNTRRYQYQKQNADGSWPETWENVAEGAASISGLSSGNYRVRRWFDPATHTPGSFANVHVGVAGVTEYAVNRPNDDGNGNYVRALPRPAEKGATVTVTVTTAAGWELTSLTATNDTTQAEITLTKTQGKDDEYTFTMPESAVSLIPTFAKKSYAITYVLDHATVDGDKPESVPHGEAFTFTLAPESEYYELPVRIKVTDAEGREVAHTYLPDSADSGKKVVGFAAGLDRDITVTVTAVEKVHHIGHNLTNINCDLGTEAAHKVAHKAALDIHLTPAEGYRLPKAIQITMGGTVLSASGFTYDRANGVISFAEGVITGDLEITAAGSRIPDPLIISASPAVLSGGGTVNLTVTVPEERFQEVVSDNTVLVVTCDDPAVEAAPTSWNNSNHTVKYSVTLPNATKTYTFTATLAANEQADYPAETATLTVSVTKAETPVSPSRPSGSGSTTTETRDDGTKVTTETKPDGSKVETTESPDGTKEVVETKKDGTVTATTESPDGTKAVVETKPDGSKTQTVEQPDGAKSELVATKDGDVTVTVTDSEGEEIAKVELPAAIPEPEEKFDDISATPWAEEAINKVAGLELVNGTGGNKYSPVAPMTRGALATVLHRLSNGKTDYDVVFKDVNADQFYAPGIAWAAKAKVVTGYTADLFAPDDVITREQLAVMLARYAKLIGMNTKADEKALEKFTDGGSTGAWAVDGMAWCVENGILKGKGQNNLDPASNVSRAEVAVMLDRFISLIK